MKARYVGALAMLAALVGWGTAAAQGGKEASRREAEQMAAMMQRARRYTQPGKNHQLLNRFLGRWTTETRMFMGARPTPPEKGTAEFRWLMTGRWLIQEGRGRLMGRALQSTVILGYDNFKMSFVSTSVTDMDTAMVHAEGDMDPGGKALILYGTLDEYLTGEHDKMVRTVWRFPDANRMVMEIHDLPIGEQNTKVVETVYTRTR